MKILRLLLAGSILLGLSALPALHGEPVLAQTTCGEPFISVSPALTDLGSGEYIRLNDGPTGFIGGLYLGGANGRPAAHETAGVGIASQILPLDAQGIPDPVDGKIGMISVGMSNTAMEFSAFITAAESDPDTNPRLQIVNGAQAGQVASEWADPASPTWDVVDQRLASAGLTPAQVQVAWVKQALTGGGDFPAKAEALQADLEAIVQNLLLHYPNTRLAFVSSRTRSYLYWNGLSPEPIAFETGFSVKWLIEKQINGDPALNFDPANGPVRAPYLSWGPYLWADGTNPRGDGFTWQPEDLVADCTHPSPSGTDKIAALLMGFFEADAVSVAWFLESPAITPTAPTPSVTPPPTGTPGPSPTPQVLPEDIFLPVVGKNFPAPAASPGQNPGNLSLAQNPGDPARPGAIFFFFLAGGFGVVLAASRRIR